MLLSGVQGFQEALAAAADRILLYVWSVVLGEAHRWRGGCPEGRSGPGHHLFLFTGVQLICNLVLLSGVQQSDSIIHIYSFSDSFPI